MGTSFKLRCCKYTTTNDEDIFNMNTDDIINQYEINQETRKAFQAPFIVSELNDVRNKCLQQPIDFNNQEECTIDNFMDFKPRPSKVGYSLEYTQEKNASENHIKSFHHRYLDSTLNKTKKGLKTVNKYSIESANKKHEKNLTTNENDNKIEIISNKKPDLLLKLPNTVKSQTSSPINSLNIGQYSQGIPLKERIKSIEPKRSGKFGEINFKELSRAKSSSHNVKDSYNKMLSSARNNNEILNNKINQNKEDDIILYGQLLKLSNNIKATNYDVRSYAYTGKFFVLTKTELKYYTSKQNFIRLLKPNMTIPLNCIIEVNFIHQKIINKIPIKKQQEKVYNIYLKIMNVNNSVIITDNTDKLSLSQNNSNNEIDCGPSKQNSIKSGYINKPKQLQNILIFASEEEAIIKTWFKAIELLRNNIN